VYAKLEAMGSRLLAMFVPSVEAEAACGPRYPDTWTNCWQCEPDCGYWAACLAVCRQNCGCQVVACIC
jgi:hypothetical protein